VLCHNCMNPVLRERCRESIESRQGFPKASSRGRNDAPVDDHVAIRTDDVGCVADRIRNASPESNPVDERLGCLWSPSPRIVGTKMIDEEDLELAEEPNGVRSLQVELGIAQVPVADSRICVVPATRSQVDCTYLSAVRVATNSSRICSSPWICK
jgi:hypothetical protein